eukprot:PhM_4_TR10056/c4_g1_i1/m.42441
MLSPSWKSSREGPSRPPPPTGVPPVLPVVTPLLGVRALAPPSSGPVTGDDRTNMSSGRKIGGGRGSPIHTSSSVFQIGVSGPKRGIGGVKGAPDTSGEGIEKMFDGVFGHTTGLFSTDWGESCFMTPDAVVVVVVIVVVVVGLRAGETDTGVELESGDPPSTGDLVPVMGVLIVELLFSPVTASAADDGGVFLSSFALATIGTHTRAYASSGSSARSSSVLQCVSTAAAASSASVRFLPRRCATTQRTYIVCRLDWNGRSTIVVPLDSSETRMRRDSWRASRRMAPMPLPLACALTVHTPRMYSFSPHAISPPLLCLRIHGAIVLSTSRLFDLSVMCPTSRP